MKCRACKSENLEMYLDLGSQPPSDRFLTKEKLYQPEIHYPLQTFLCLDCGLSQLGFVVPKETLFGEDYRYDASVTSAGREHWNEMASSIVEKFRLGPNSLVVDVGCNVGVLLSAFKSKGARVVGIEPTKALAEIARSNGIETLPEYMGTEVAKKVKEKYGNVSVVTMTNVFAHIDDWDGVMNSLDIMQDDDGIFVIEAPHMINLINMLEYDTIYHEHLSYLSIKPLVVFFKRFGREIFDVVRFENIHGGSVRIFVGKIGRRYVSQNVTQMIADEEKEQVHSLERLKRFASDVKAHREALINLLMQLKLEGKKIVGIGAAAKGTTLLNYCKIGPELLEYLTDKSTMKQGLFSPGMHLPIYSDEKFLEDKPDYALILPWNWGNEIMRNLTKYKEAGGKFIMPLPGHPKIIS